MKDVLIEYGDTHMRIEVPDTAIVVRDGETHREPEPLPDPVEATRQALRNPLGTKPIRELVNSRSRVVIAFPDRVKGGFHPTAHRRVTIPLIMEELAAAGVPKENVTLICAVGLHRKNRREEFAEYLGRDIVDQFLPSQIINHDPEDPEGMVDLGETAHGDVVDFNRHAFEADLTILLGHTQGNPYGGYSGGYKMPCTGLTGWRSIRCHHTPSTMHRDDFVPVSTSSYFRNQLRTIGKTIEKASGKDFFLVDAVLNGYAQQIGVFAGIPDAVEEASWPVATSRTHVDIPGEPADVLVVGMPRNFHYGPGMGSNPILMLQAAGSSITRAAAALRPDPVVIVASVCDGWFNDDDFPATRELYEVYQNCVLPDELTYYEDDFARRPEYIHKFRWRWAYHPFHGFSMAYMGGIALKRTQAVIVAGAKSPGHARGMGAIPTRTFDDALKLAEKYVGKNPKIIVVPELSKPAVHLRATG